MNVRFTVSGVDDATVDAILDGLQSELARVLDRLGVSAGAGVSVQPDHVDEKQDEGRPPGDESRHHHGEGSIVGAPAGRLPRVGWLVVERPWVIDVIHGVLRPVAVPHSGQRAGLARRS